MFDALLSIPVLPPTSYDVEVAVVIGVPEAEALIDR
jgi:hypothetical protein